MNPYVTTAAILLLLVVNVAMLYLISQVFKAGGDNDE